MLRTSADSFVEALRQHQLLDSQEIQALLHLSESRGHDARRLAQHALKRGWLTPYQVNQLMQGRGANLQLGPYVLLERLGQGGMAVVFKARHRLIDRVVALKLIRPDFLKKPDAVRRFRREVQVAAQLSHPNIVLALDADEVGGTHFFVMEYVDGINLLKLVKENGPLPIAQACDCVRQAANGLAHAHEKGLVHRDIKPSNLMLTRSAGSKSLDLVKLLDMGLARLELPGAADESTDLTHAGVLIGTPEFIAPEQAINAHDADIRADLYSLGGTFYYLLTGQVPFPGGTAIQKLFQHKLEQARPIEELRSDVPLQVTAIVRKLMAKLPEERFQQPAELAAALETCLKPGALPSADFADLALDARHNRNKKGVAERRRPGDTGKTLILKGRRFRSLRALRGKHWLRAMLIGTAVLLICLAASFFLLVRDNRPGVDKKADDALAGDDPARQALRKLITKAENPKTDVKQLRQELVEFRLQYAGNPARARAAELLQQLPSALDSLSGQAVPPEERLDGQLGAELVLVLGDARLHHGGPALSIAISPDGRSLLSGGEDRMVYQWDAANGNRQRLFAGHGAPVTAVAWSPNGRTAVSASHDWTARLLDIPAGKEKSILRHGGNVRCVAVSPDSRLVATGSHPDQGKPSGPIRLWDMEGKEVGRLEGHQGPVLALAFAPNGPWLASGGEDKTVRLWDLNQRKEVGNLGGHQGHVLALAFSADGQTLASGGADKNLRVWDVGQRKERTGARDFGHTISGLSFVPKTPLLAASLHDGTLRLIDMGNGQEKGVLRGHHGGVNALATAADGQNAVSAGHDGSVRRWDLTKQKENGFHRKLPAIQSVTLAPDDRTIATGHQGGTIRLWDAAKNGKELAGLERHQHGVPAVAFSPDGKTLLSGGWDHLAVVWDVGQRKERHQLRGHNAGVTGVAFAPDGSLAASASHDATARLWELSAGKEKAVLRGHSQGLNSLSFAPDSKTLATGAFERHIKIWDVGSAKEKGSLWEFTGEGLAFLADSKSVASGSSHGSICLWDTLSKAGASKILPGLNLGWIKTVAVSQDGKTLALANHDGRVILWNLAQGKEQRQLRLPGTATGLAFAADGRHLLCLVNNGNVYVLRLATHRT